MECLQIKCKIVVSVGVLVSYTIFDMLSATQDVLFSLIFASRKRYMMVSPIELKSKYNDIYMRVST